MRAKNKKTFTQNLKTTLGRGVFVSDEDTHTLRLKSELFDLRVGYANPILQQNVAEVGSRPLVLRDKNKHHPRGMVFVFMAQEEGFEPPCLLGKRFSRPPRCDRFDIPAYIWCGLLHHI